MAATAETNAPRSGRDFGEAFLPEDDVVMVARRLAADVGLTPISPSTGATLSMLAAATSARAAIEIGDPGYRRGRPVVCYGAVRTDGVLTTIDIDAEHQRVARRIFAEAGYAASRTRVITGQRARRAAPARGRCLRSSRPGRRPFRLRRMRQRGTALAASGWEVLALNGVLAGGRIADTAMRDPQTVALRDLVRSFRDNDYWRPALLPVGDGLLCAVRV